MISVVIPAYNESKIIGDVIGELIIELNKTENDYEIIVVDEIGDKIADSIILYFSNKENLKLIKRLKTSGLIFHENQSKNESNKNKLRDLNFVISGTFTNYSREEIKNEIIINGGKVLSSLSSKTNYLLAGKNIGPQKEIKAIELNIKILSEKDFVKMI